VAPAKAASVAREGFDRGAAMTRLGFVGLGVMGRPMAQHLLAAGHEVTVFARTQASIDVLTALGAQAASSSRDLAARSDVVVTMVPDSAAVRAVVLGADGVLAGLSPGSLLIDMSTIHPSLSIEVAAAAAERDVAALDAPVSGGELGAREATLSIMVGGGAAAFERAKPILALLGDTIVHVGGAGAGQVVKACNQIVVGVTFACVAEALVLGSKAGVDPARILDVLTGGLADNRIMHARRRNFLEHDFTPGFRVDLHHKDLLIATETATELDVAVPTTSLALQMMRALRHLGHGSSDHSSLLALIEVWSGHEITAPQASRTEPV
jgi:2-hydroxy-3-oxopropionate reductase